MRNVFALLLLFGLFWPFQAFPLEIVDDLDQVISLDKPAERIVPLYGAFAEMLYAIGAGGKIIARTQADRFPVEILKLPSIGTHMRPNVEMILGLKPDLVIHSASRAKSLPEMERLREAHIPVALFAPKTFDDIFSTMRRLGVLAGKEVEAASKIDDLKDRLQAVNARLSRHFVEGQGDAGGGVESRKTGSRVRVFFEIRAEPLTGAGRGSIVQQIIEHAGAQNVLKNEKAVVLYNFESLLLDDPDVYIVQRGPMNRNPIDPRKRAHFDRLRAVREGKILFVDEFLFSRPGPRCVDAVEKLAAELYPQYFSESRMQ